MTSPSLRQAIAQALAAHEAQPPAQRRTPSGVPIPDNFNRLGRPPRTLNLAPEVVRALATPGFPARLRADMPKAQGDPNAGALINELMTDLRQFRRAERHERALPGEYMGDDSLPTQPMPYAPREQHRPDRLPGSHAHAVMKAGLDQLDADDITRGLADKMGTSQKVDAIEAREDSQPPSLRESVQSAFNVHTQEN